MLPKNELEIGKVGGVGPKSERAFKKLGILTTKDLIYFLPKRILDLTKIELVSNARSLVGEQICIFARIKSTNITRSKIKKIWIVEALLEDKSGSIEAVWYNQPFRYKSLRHTDEFVFKGEVSISGKKVFINNPEIFPQKGIYPIYRQTKNLSSKIINKLVIKLLKPHFLPQDLLPNIVRKDNSLPDIEAAARYCHQPKSEIEFQKGKRRFLFEELFLFILKNLMIRDRFLKEKAPKINAKLPKGLIEKLPFDLTGDQLRTLGEIVTDFNKTYPMNRLIQGDVGSGKTIIVFLAAVIVANSGYRVAFLAPTQILALQHFEVFITLVKRLRLKNISVNLITSKDKKFSEGANIFVGTHALLNLKIPNLGMMIVDEQQRFGVEQRATLLEGNQYMPHYLSLSATPIPRSLSHVIFSNCDLSAIREKPKNRKKIKTYLIPEQKRLDTYLFISREIKKGRQAFLICPLIDSEVEDDKKSVERELLLLKKTILGKFHLGALHGRLLPEKKEKIIKDFKEKKLDLLVSTSVVEVGVDIENATVILIEDAQSFGLAQLHQFRGRVGRGNEQSYCFVFAKFADNQTTRDRLKIFVRSDDGFKLSNEDLRLRGPGAFFDRNQSGFSKINPLWFEKADLLKNASDAAKKIAHEIRSYPILKKQIESEIKIKHLN